MGWVLPVICFVVAVVVLLAGLRLMGRFQWVVSFLRGALGIGLVVLSVGVAAFGMDLLSYQEGSRDESVATLSFIKLDDQKYRAIMVDSDGLERKFELSGDQWQLDANIIKWSGVPANSLYRLDRISGRYILIEQERRQSKSAYDLALDRGQLDAWAAVRNYGYLFPFIDALYGSATYLPMADGAIYSISLAQSGLIGRPVNEAAQVAVRGWL